MKIILLAGIGLLGASPPASPSLPSLPIQQVGNPSIGFERLAHGEFKRRKTRLGLMQVVAGQAAIDPEHASKGKRCLHLLGGEGTSVTLRVNAQDLHEIRFEAERWTARAPFVFTVEAEVDGQWVVIEDASSKIKVGGFKTTVSARIPTGVRTLRLNCTSPPNTGVLIDELQLISNAQMACKDLIASQPTLPCLVGNRLNPILRVDLQWTGNSKPLVVQSITIDLDGTTHLQDIETVRLLRGPMHLDYRNPETALTEAFGQEQKAREGPITFQGKWTVGEGHNHIWISVTPKSNADIDGFVDAGLLSIELADGQKIVPVVTHPDGSQRMGIALRNAGSDRVPVYRIPGLVTSNVGTLLSVYDLRHEGWRDLPGNIDVGLSRSTDGGQTWDPMRVILDMGNAKEYTYDGVGDPAILVDRGTGTIWVVATWHHGNLGWNGSGPGFEPHETGQLILTRSDDDGLTWSAPINITRQVKQQDWCFLLQGPGRGITMEDGKIVFPAQYQLGLKGNRQPRSTVLWSSDHGTTWHLGTEAKSNTTEAAVVELKTGQLMLSMRDNRGRTSPGWRAVSTSNNMGSTWKNHKASNKALKEPVCMASLIHVGRELGGKADGQLLFSNPAVGRAPRRNLSITRSTDFGQTWDVAGALLLDEGNSAGYSCLTMINEHTVGIVYECSRAHLAFQRIPLKDIRGL